MSRKLGTSRKGVWVVLPTYCEAENILVVIERLRGAMPEARILVVDDNSPDGTADIVRQQADGGRVELIVRKAKTGLGDAYLEGFRYVLDRGAEIVVTMDADMSHDPNAVPALVEDLEDGGCVVGSRYVEGGSIVNWPFRRKLLSAAANRFVKLLFSMPVMDCTSGFRVYSRRVVEEILAADPCSHGYSFQVEALRIAVASGLPIKESPIVFVERANGASKMGLREIVFGARSLFLVRILGDRGGSERGDG